jgi:hypothetical protein
MSHHTLASYAKKHYRNIDVCSLDKLENRYVFICNSMFAALNRLAIDEGSKIVIEKLDIEKNGIPIFSITSSFDIDINLLISYEYLYAAVSY